MIKHDLILNDACLDFARPPPGHWAESKWHDTTDFGDLYHLPFNHYRFFLYTTEENYKDKKPDMVVYYLSIPDTAPEFLKKSKLEEYFKDAIARLKKD